MDEPTDQQPDDVSGAAQDAQPLAQPSADAYAQHTINNATGAPLYVERPKEFNPATAVPAGPEEQPQGDVPQLLKRPDIPFNPATAVPQDQAEQQAARDELEKIYSGSTDMPTLERFREINNIAERGTGGAVARTASGAAATLGGVVDFGRSLGDAKTYEHGWEWVHGLSSEMVKPYADAVESVSKGDYKNAAKKFVEGEYNNAKTLGVSMLAGTERIVPQAIGIAQGNANIMQEVSGLSALKRSVGMDGTTEKYLSAWAQHNANQKIQELYQDTKVDPDKRLAQIGELVPWIMAPEALGVGGATGLAARIGEAAPSVIQKGAQVGAKVGEFGLKKGAPVAGGVAVAAAGHPIAGLEMALGALSDKPLKMGGILLGPARLVNYFADWSGGQLGKLADLLGQQGLPGDNLSQAIARNVRTGASELMQQATADLKASVKPEDFVEWLKKDASGRYIHNMENAPKQFATFLKTEQQAQAMGVKANFFDSLVKSNKILSSVVKGAVATAAGVVEGAGIGGVLGSAEAAPGDTTPIRQSAAALAAFAAPLAPFAAVSGFRGLKAEEAAKLMQRGYNYAKGDHSDAFNALSPQRQAEVNMINGMLAGTGRKVVVADQNVGGAGHFDPDTGIAYLKPSAVEAVGVHGHEVSHVFDDLSDNIMTDAYEKTMSGVTDHASTAPLVNFFQNYMEARRRSNPNAPNLTPKELLQEATAELTRHILNNTSPAEFFGGKTGSQIIKEKISDFFNKEDPNAPKTVNAFGSPWTPKQYRALSDALYEMGARAKAGTLAEEGAAVTGAGTPAVNIPIPASVHALAKQQGFDIPEEHLQQAVNELGAGAAPADVIIKAFKDFKGAGAPPEAGVAPPEKPPQYGQPPEEGTPAADVWEYETNRRVREYMDQGIPEEQAVQMAANEMQDLEKNKEPKGQGLEAKFMPESEDPVDRTRGAFIRMPDGKEFRDITHAAALYEAYEHYKSLGPEALKQAEPILDKYDTFSGPIESGYVTKSGKYLTRDEATNRLGLPNQRGQAMPDFYSPTAKVIDQKMPERAPKKQVLALLAGGNKAEVEWSGVKDYVEGLPEGAMVDKRDLLKRLNEGLPQIKETKLSDATAISVNDVARREYGKDYDELGPAYQRSVMDTFNSETDGPQYDRPELNLPGGTNYRELLWQLPTTEVKTNAEKFTIQPTDPEQKQLLAAGMTHQVKGADGRNIFTGTQQAAENYVNYQAQHASNFPLPADKIYTPPHFEGEYPNTAVHARVDDRVDPVTGGKMLLAQELQSDHAQDIRKKGVAHPEKTEALQAKARELMKIWENDKTPQNAANWQQASVAAQEVNLGVPDMPFKGNTWKKLGLRQLIKHAVEGGYDSLAWTTGEQQAARYDLSKHIDEIVAQKTSQGNFNLDLVKGGSVLQSISKVPPSDLGKYVGKDLAEKISKQTDDHKLYSGLDLKVGGEGMKGFYDKELVNIANDIGKRFGARVEDAKIPAGQKVPIQDIDQPANLNNIHPEWVGGSYLLMDSDTGQRLLGSPHFNVQRDAQEYLKNLKSRTEGELETVHRLPITKAMVDSVKEHGQPMFMPDTHPEAINSENPAAFRTPDGRIHVGSWHPDAFSAATAAYPAEQLSKWYNRLGGSYMERGFVNNRGDFLSPEDATRAALARKQVSLSDVKKLMRGKGYGEDPRGLESLAFRESQKKQGNLEAQQGQAMPEVNIGMHVGGEEKLTAKDIASALEATGVKVTKLSEQRKEGFEPTVVATLSRALTPDEGHAVSEALGQDAIAQHQMAGQGNLFGPRTEAWGADPNIPNSGFNPDFFLTHEGEILSDVVKRDRKLSEPLASGLWDRMTVDPNFMEGQLPKIAEQLGIPDDKRFMEQKPADRQKIKDYFLSQQLARFMPSTHPEAVKESAIKMQDGKVFTGPLHSHALERAREYYGSKGTKAMNRFLRWEDESYYTDGFVNNKGKFLDREQAYDTALRLNQIPEKTDLGFIHGPKFDLGPSLESTMFEDARRFMPSPHPEAIKEPAYKMKDGTIISQPVGYHSMIELPKGQYGHNIDKYGFVTNKGEFLDRKQALARALERGQISKQAADPRNWTETAIDQQLHAPDVKEGSTSVDWQYMPDTHPEAIESAAVHSSKDDSIFKGATHNDATSEALSAGHGLSFLKNGFVTKQGKFLDPEQAYAHARSINQYTQKPLLGELESNYFNGGRQFMPDIEKARSIAEEAHKDQTRKFSGAPYFTHLDDVAKLVNDKLKPAAYLHDVFEDTPLKVADLRELGVPEDTIQLVRGLSKRPNEDYSHFIDRIKGNPDARDIKTADLMHNLSTLPEGSTLRKRYVGALNQLIPDDNQLINALSSDKVDKIGAARDLPAGTPVSLRIDIPAYNKTGDYAVTVHERNVGKALGYDGIATVDNPTFYAQERGAQKVKEGMAKYPMAAVNGEFDPARTFPDDIGSYKMVGFNPLKHSYFYEKGTDKPVIGGDRAISAGNTVFVKNPVYGNPTGFLYMPDAIDRVAIKDENGKIHTGDLFEGGYAGGILTHGALLENMGISRDTNFERGFMTKSGKYLNADQALDHARKIKQLDKKDAEGMSDLDTWGMESYANFMPDAPDVPMAIDRAALRRKSDGEVITGAQNDTHFMIPNTTKGVDDYLGINGHKLYEEGFVDHNKNWYDREQALTQMKSMGQLPPSFQGEYKDELNVTGLRQSRAGDTTIPADFGRQQLDAGMFMPDAHPEAVKEAAIKWPDGEVTTGATHYNAAGANEVPEDAQLGFVLNNGKFVSMDQGWEAAKKHGQVAPENERVVSEDIEAIGSYPMEGQFMPDTPEAAAAQTAAEADKFPEALPLRWQTDENGNVKMTYNSKTKRREAVPVVQGYNLKDQPLAAEAAAKVEGKGPKLEAATDAAADAMIPEARKAMKNPQAMEAKGWYRDLKNKLESKLGGVKSDLILFTRLLATTSPNTNPAVNFGFALDAWNRLKKGDYDELIKKYDDVLAKFNAGELQHGDGSTVTGQKQFEGYLRGHDLIPYASGVHEKTTREHKAGDPKKLGMHSLRVLDTISDHYDRIKGLKINQFAHNLAQTDLNATIDLWAARLLHRLLNKGNTEPWRILPMSEQGISAPDFQFGQMAFAKAAKKLGVSTDDLQAIMWFHEKLHYDKKGWSTYLDKGDFRPLVDRMQVGPKGTFSLSAITPPQ